jgi:hypothetical protein
MESLEGLRVIEVISFYGSTISGLPRDPGFWKKPRSPITHPGILT